jgi:hypothetical protein
MTLAKDVEANVTYLPTKDGGRSLPAVSNYRPQFYYSGHDWDAVHTYPDVEKVEPGQTARVFLTFLSPGEHLGKIYPGMPFWNSPALPDTLRRCQYVTGGGKWHGVRTRQNSSGRQYV